MAIYFLGMKTFGRARGTRGSRATSGAAYRSGERIRDERTGAVYDHRGRLDVMHKEIVLPARLAAGGAALDWARNRSALWNAAEVAERNKNARVAREFTVALPHELAPERRVALARRFAQEISDRYGNAVDLAIHAPRGDPRNFHAHLFTTTREVTPQGLGPKTTLELSGTERHHRGLPRWTEELTSLRERWATLANEMLKEAHIEARLEPLSRAEAMSRASVPRLPSAAYHIERRGGHSFIADWIREKHRAALERPQPEPPRSRPQLTRSGPELARWQSEATRTGRAIVEQIRARTRAAWTALRSRFEDPRSTEKLQRQIAAPERAREAAPALGQPSPSPEHMRQAGPTLERPSPAREHPQQASHSHATSTAELDEAWARRLTQVQRESVRNWLAYREAQRLEGRDLSAEESARKWAEHRRSGQEMSAGDSGGAQEREKTRSHDFDMGP